MTSSRVPKGFTLTGVHCGIKSDPNVEDLTLILSDQPATAAGVFTQNVVYAAAVGRNRKLTPNGSTRAVVTTSGNANTCTGKRGEEDNLEIARLAAQRCSANADEVLVMSTGIIGEYLPMEKISTGINAAAQQLGSDDESFHLAARGFLTTDKAEKTSMRVVDVTSGEIRISGIAKGAGMIGPKMATMLSAIMTDAMLTPDDAQSVLTAAVEESFNCMSVEGHMSTSDTVLLLANGAANNEALAGNDLTAFSNSLIEVCIELARMMADDGEGASHLINIEVRGCKTRAEAHQIAKTVANSALVKTGIAGADPNWGRIISAAGYSGIQFDPQRLSFTLNGFKLYIDGEPQPFDEATVSASIRDNRETDLLLELAEGGESCRFWTSDLTPEYVRFNSEYHT